MTIHECSLFWNAKDVETNKFVFLVASKDKNGMFYHLGTVAHNKIDLLPAIINKAEMFIVLEIAENGIRDRHEMTVFKRKYCLSQLKLI